MDHASSDGDGGGGNNIASMKISHESLFSLIHPMNTRLSRRRFGSCDLLYLKKF